MDGASSSVPGGDAIARMITLVNICGGLVIGPIFSRMSMGKPRPSHQADDQRRGWWPDAGGTVHLVGSHLLVTRSSQRVNLPAELSASTATPSRSIVRRRPLPGHPRADGQLQPFR